MLRRPNGCKFGWKLLQIGFRKYTGFISSESSLMGTVD